MLDHGISEVLRHRYHDSFDWMPVSRLKYMQLRWFTNVEAKHHDADICTLQ